MNKTDKISIANLFSDGINTIGVVATTILSFLITVACSVSDYTQISSLIDSVQHESAFTVVIFSLTICIFLNFSLYVAGTIIKRMVCGRPVAGSVALSVICVILGFLLFGAVFALTFKFKYALKDYLFSVEPSGAIDSVINKAVKAGSDVLNKVTDVKPGDAEIIRISAILSGLMPAFTSVLSMLSVFLFYDPLASDKSTARFKLIFYKYRYLVTKKEFEAVGREVKRLERLPSEYQELLKDDYKSYLLFRQEIEDSEMIARTAEYTAAIELFKDDQDTVTRLSSEAKSIVTHKPFQPHDANMTDADLPDSIVRQINSADELFDRWKSNYGSGLPSEAAPSAPDKTEEPGRNEVTSSSVILPEDDDGDESDTPEPDEEFEGINIPDFMVSPQLSKAVNQ